MSKKILITNDIPEKGIALLRQAGFEVTVWTGPIPMPAADLERLCQQHDALLCTSPDKINAGFLKTCSHLDIISQFAAGYDNIDIAVAAELGIPIGNAPNAMSEATADIAFGLMIVVARKMFFLHKKIERGQWGPFYPQAHLGIELKGKTLGIFGLGNIGLEMARRCKGAYSMDIIYYNRNRNLTAEKELGATWVPFEHLLAQSDILSVHCALTDETRGIFNAGVFQKMKPSALFINTSRGGVHNETDLIAALKNGVIAGAGLDVTNPEPMYPDNPLLAMENAAVLPHIGSATVEARNEMSRLAAQNIVDFYQTGNVSHRVV